MTRKKCDIIVTLSDFSTLLHIWEVWTWEVWNLGWERKVGLFHTSTPLRSIELRVKKESRDLVASAGHLSLTLHRLQGSTFLSTNYLKRSKLPIPCLQNRPLFCDSWTVVDIVRKSAEEVKKRGRRQVCQSIDTSVRKKTIWYGK